MNLFKNRPLALVCAVVILFSGIAYRISASIKIAAIAVLALLFIIVIVLGVKYSQIKIKAIFTSFCLFAAILAIGAQLVFVDMKYERIQEYEGTRFCEVLVVSEGKSSGKVIRYDARVSDIEGESVSFDANLYLSFSAELSAGDVLYVKGSISDYSYLYGGGGSVEPRIDIFVYEPSDAVLVSEDNISIDIIFGKLRDRVAEYFDHSFGERAGALARGIFIGDTRDISADTIRDFRRSGTSHLLAVSGLHISMLIGVVDLVLRKLSIGRRARCVVICFFSLVFLGMTGFAISACRAVCMLLFVYLHFIFVKESDSITALFSAVAVIMLISPTSVTDVGLWLSFLATLGIIAAYTPITRYFRTSGEKDIKSRLLRGIKKAVLALLLTFICNAFTCMIIWSVFGEMSTVSLISNPILTPISLVFIVAIPIAAIFAPLGMIGKAFVSGLSAIAEIIFDACGFFASIDGALISLRYAFAGIIIIGMSIALAVMLVVNLKHKQFILLPPFIALAAFALCLGIHNAYNSGRINAHYSLSGDNEIVVITERHSASVIDISSGAYSFVKRADTLAKEGYATEIEDYVVTHYHEAHAVSLEVLFGRSLVRRVWLPMPSDDDEYRIAREISDAAEKHGCELEFFERSDVIHLLSDTRIAIRKYENSGKAHNAIAVFIANKNEAMTYIGADMPSSEQINRFSAASDHIILGTHGGKAIGDISYATNKDILKSIFYADEDMAINERGDYGDAKILTPNQNREAEIYFILD